MAIWNTGLTNHAAHPETGFKIDAPVYTGVPRMKYTFEVEFRLNSTVRMEDDSFGRTFVFNRVMSANMPDYDYGIQPLNQYNRMRYVPTRLTVNPVGITFYDTKDNQFQTLLKAYAGHYFGHEIDGAHDLDSKHFSGYDILGSKFGTSDSHPFGAKSISGDARHFFEEIRIRHLDTAQGGRLINLYNCMITNIAHDVLDYSASAPVMFNVNFQPEHVNIGNIGDTNPNLSAQSAVQSDVAGTVANRPSAQKVQEFGQRLYTGGVLAANEVIRNIDGKQFVVKLTDAEFNGL